VFGAEMGIEVPRDLALRIPAHIKFKLTSLRMDRQGHLYSEDTLCFLVRRGISSCWRNPESSLPKQVFYSNKTMIHEPLDVC
jgi:hypothetical protein